MPERSTPSFARPVLRVVRADAAQPDDGAPCGADQLFDRFAPYVATIAFHVLGRDDEDVDDVVQEAFTALVRLGRPLPPGEARRFLATVAVRTARRLRRRRWLRRLLHRPIELEETIASAAASPEDRAAFAALHARLDRLPSGQRTAWVLRHLEGETLPEVARLCGVSLATSKRWLRAAAIALGEPEDREP